MKIIASKTSSATARQETLRAFFYEEDFAHALLSLDIDFARDDLELLVNFGLEKEEDCTRVASFKYSVSPNIWAHESLMKDNTFARSRTSAERDTTRRLEAAPRDGFILSAIKASRRDAFKNDCVKVSTEIDPENIKYAQIN